MSKFLLASVTDRNDMYLDELKEVLEERCGLSVSESTVWRTLQRAGFRLKEVRLVSSINRYAADDSDQITKHAKERNEILRAQYRFRIAENYTAEQLVFVDESACDRRTYLWNRAWALEGLRACRKQVFTRGRRYVNFSKPQQFC